MHTFQRGGRVIDLVHGPFGELAPLLAVQLWSLVGRGELLDVMAHDALVRRDLAPGLAAVLVFDLGTHEENIPTSRLATWGISRDDAFKIAFDNILSRPFEAKRLELEDGPAFVLIGNGPFVAALALEADAVARGLQGFPPTESAPELLVAVPNWHTLLIAPGVPGRARPELAALAEKLFDYTDPVSPQVFRVTGGSWSPA